MKYDQKILIPAKSAAATTAVQPQDVKLNVALKVSKTALVLIIGLLALLVLGLALLLYKQFEQPGGKTTRQSGEVPAQPVVAELAQPEKLERLQAVTAALAEFSAMDRFKIEQGFKQLCSNEQSESKLFLAGNLALQLRASLSADESGMLGSEGYGVFSSQSRQAEQTFNSWSEEHKVSLYVKYFRALRDVVDLMEQARQKQQRQQSAEQDVAKRFELFEKELSPQLQAFEQQRRQLQSAYKGLEMQVQANLQAVSFDKNLAMAVECRKAKQASLEGEALGVVHKIPQNLPGRPLALRYKLRRDALGNLKNVAITCTYDVTRKQLLYDPKHLVYKALEYYGAPSLVALGQRSLPFSDNPFENKQQQRFAELHKQRKQVWDQEREALYALYSKMEQLVYEQRLQQNEQIKQLLQQYQQRKLQIKQLEQAWLFLEQDLLAARKLAEAFYACKDMQIPAERWRELWKNVEDIAAKSAEVESYEADLTINLGWKFADGTRLVISIPPTTFHKSLKVRDKSASYVYISLSDANSAEDNDAVYKIYDIGRTGAYEERLQDLELK